MLQSSGCSRRCINNLNWSSANCRRKILEKSMDWLLKGGLYIDLNKFYGYADIHDYVVGNFRNGCLRSYKVQESKGSLESASIFTTGYIDCYGHKQSYKGIRNADIM